MSVLSKAPDSQFAYVVVTARRARQFTLHQQRHDGDPRKTTRIAEEELQKGLLEYEMAEMAEEGEDKDGKRRKD